MDAEIEKITEARKVEEEMAAARFAETEEKKGG